MPLVLDAFTARLPELGTAPRHGFLLLEVTGRRFVPQDDLSLTAGVYRADSASEGDARNPPPPRAPLCVALAIDASSSMRGPRFALAVQAARDLIESLQEQDRVAVVTFDRSARVVFGPTAGDLEGRQSARQALDRLATGRGTNIGAGWREAADALSRLIVPGAARRVFVLTDGMPSSGEVAPDLLRKLVADGHSRGVETTVIGIGDGIDAGLCALLARAGDGRFHYLRDEGLLGDVVANEIEGTKRLAAADVSLLIALSQRVQRAEVMHRYVCQPDGRTLEVRIGAVGYDMPRAVLIQLEVDTPAEDTLLGAALARGRALQPPNERSGAGEKRRPPQETVEGYALGARPAQEPGDDGQAASERLSLRMAAGVGSLESRRRVAHEVVTLRTAAEIRSAWDAFDARDREAISRRLGRARELRRTLSEAGLLVPERLAELPDVGAIEGAMLSGGSEWREARRTFQSWAHNTQVSQIFFARKSPQKP